MVRLKSNGGPIFRDGPHLLFPQLKKPRAPAPTALAQDLNDLACAKRMGRITPRKHPQVAASTHRSLLLKQAFQRLERNSVFHQIHLFYLKSTFVESAAMELRQTPFQDSEQKPNTQVSFKLASIIVDEDDEEAALLPFINNDRGKLIRIKGDYLAKSKYHAHSKRPVHSFLSGRIPAFFHPIVDLFQPLTPLGRGESFGIL